jgi:dTDP-4-amino-4,6-dideoxygalactose transaminase
MSNAKLYLSSPHMGGHEIQFVNQAFDTNWIAPLGPNVDGFEADLCAYAGIKHAAALSSGTAAIHLALILLGVKAEDEVICSTFTFSASCNPILYQGATPVFVDSESKTWNMSPEFLEAAIKDRIARGKKPKAIILVHLYGMPAQMDELMTIANQYEIPVIEDAAEALGSTYNGKALGTFGKFGVLSFNGNKIITTSGGGALLSDNEADIIHARKLATQARDTAPHYQHSEIGYNYRMSNVCAGIGRGQMLVLQDRVNRRREINEIYRERFLKIPQFEWLYEPEGFFSNRWLSCVLLQNYERREQLRLVLEAKNIESRPLWKPMHLQPIFETYPFYGDGTSEVLFDRGLCLPSGSALINNDLDKIVAIVKKIFH